MRPRRLDVNFSMSAPDTLRAPAAIAKAVALRGKHAERMRLMRRMLPEDRLQFRRINDARKKEFELKRLSPNDALTELAKLPKKIPLTTKMLSLIAAKLWRLHRSPELVQSVLRTIVDRRLPPDMIVVALTLSMAAHAGDFARVEAIAQPLIVSVTRVLQRPALRERPLPRTLFSPSFFQLPSVEMDTTDFPALTATPASSAASPLSAAASGGPNGSGPPTVPSSTPPRTRSSARRRAAALGFAATAVHDTSNISSDLGRQQEHTPKTSSSSLPSSSSALALSLSTSTPSTVVVTGLGAAVSSKAAAGVCLRVLLLTAAAAGDHTAVVRWWRATLRAGVAPCVRCFDAVTVALAALGKAEQLARIVMWWVIEREGFPAPAGVGRGMQASLALGNQRDVLRLAFEIRAQRVPLSRASYACIFAACATLQATSTALTFAAYMSEYTPQVIRKPKTFRVGFLPDSAVLSSLFAALRFGSTRMPGAIVRITINEVLPLALSQSSLRNSEGGVQQFALALSARRWKAGMPEEGWAALKDGQLGRVQGRRFVAEATEGAIGPFGELIRDPIVSASSPSLGQTSVRSVDVNEGGVYVVTPCMAVHVLWAMSQLRSKPEVFSRFWYLIPLRSMTAEVVVAAMRCVFSFARPRPALVLDVLRRAVGVAKNGGGVLRASDASYLLALSKGSVGGLARGADVVPPDTLRSAVDALLASCVQVPSAACGRVRREASWTEAVKSSDKVLRAAALRLGPDRWAVDGPEEEMRSAAAAVGADYRTEGGEVGAKGVTAVGEGEVDVHLPSSFSRAHSEAKHLLDDRDHETTDEGSWESFLGGTDAAEDASDGDQSWGDGKFMVSKEPHHAVASHNRDGESRKGGNPLSTDVRRDHSASLGGEADADFVVDDPSGLLPAHIHARLHRRRASLSDSAAVLSVVPSVLHEYGEGDAEALLLAAKEAGATFTQSDFTRLLVADPLAASSTAFRSAFGRVCGGSARERGAVGLAGPPGRLVRSKRLRKLRATEASVTPLSPAARKRGRARSVAMVRLTAKAAAKRSPSALSEKRLAMAAAGGDLLVDAERGVGGGMGEGFGFGNGDATPHGMVGVGVGSSAMSAFTQSCVPYPAPSIGVEEEDIFSYSPRATEPVPGSPGTPAPRGGRGGSSAFALEGVVGVRKARSQTIGRRADPRARKRSVSVRAGRLSTSGGRGGLNVDPISASAKEIDIFSGAPLGGKVPFVGRGGGEVGKTGLRAPV